MHQKRSLNHWTKREVPRKLILSLLSLLQPSLPPNTQPTHSVQCRPILRWLEPRNPNSIHRRSERPRYVPRDWERTQLNQGQRRSLHESTPGGIKRQLRSGKGEGGRVLVCELGHLTHLEASRARGNPGRGEGWQCPFQLLQT